MNFTTTFTHTQLLLLYSVAALWAIQLIYLYLIYLLPSRMARGKRGGKRKYNDTPPPLSVILYANNNEEYLVQSLTRILEQEYPQFEVVLVNDGSLGEIEHLLTPLQQRYPNLLTTFIPDGVRNISRKKLAVTLGLKAAHYEHVVLTTTNSLPSSTQWLAAMGRNFVDGVDIVLGYSYTHPHQGVGQKLLCYDRFRFMMNFLAAALLRCPYMGQGNNLAYRRSLFFSGKGFSQHLNLHGGDDDLLIHHLSNHRNTRVELSAQSQMEVLHYNCAKEWWRTKLHYLFTSRYIRSLSKWILASEQLFRYLFYAALGVSLYLMEGNGWIALAAGGALLLFWAGYLLSYQSAVKQLSAPKLGLSLLLFDLLLPCLWMGAKVENRLQRRSNYTK